MRSNGRTIAFVAALLFSPATASAGGLFVPGLGPQAQARAGAFVAKADDPTALFHNPAGFVKQTGTVVYIGANLLDFKLRYHRAGVYDATGENLAFEGQPYAWAEDESSPALGIGPLQAIPLIAVSTDFGLKLPVRFGIGFYAPHAYPEREFSPDYEFEADPNEAPPPQRYDMMKQEALVALPSLAVAYRVNDKLDLGARVSWGYGELKATTYIWGIRNYEEWVARDGVFDVDVNDKFVPAYGFGALFRPTPAFELGAAFHSKVSVEGKGTGNAVLGSDLGIGDQHEYIVPVADEYAVCGTGGVEGALKACVNVNLPMMATLGGRYILRDEAGAEKADVELDVRWENWSSASDIHVIVDGQSGITGLPINESILRHGYQDVFSVRLGGAYALPMGANKLGLRAGVAYDTATAKKQYERVDMDGAARLTLGAGIAYELSKVRIDFGGGYVIEPERTVDSCNPTVSEPGCPPGTDDKPVADRDSPDPLQPLIGANNQVESPYNGGVYRSHYLLLSLGATYQF